MVLIYTVIGAFQFGHFYLNIFSDLGAFDAEQYEQTAAFDGEQTRSRREATPANLTRWRWRMPVLAADEERDLIRAAKAGDAVAKDELARRFHRLVLRNGRQI